MKHVKLVLGVILLLFIDQITKYIVASKMLLGQSIQLIDGVFELNYVQNKGAAWGMFQGRGVVFIIISIVISIIGILLYYRASSEKKYTSLRILIVFIISGALGNAIDRIFRGYVVDFFYFRIINFPVFNVADMYLTISLALMIILLFFKFKDDDFEYLFSIKGNKLKENLTNSKVSSNDAEKLSIETEELPENTDDSSIDTDELPDNTDDSSIDTKNDK